MNVNNTIHIGTSGFSFPDWRGGVIYPEGLKKKEELIYYANALKFDCLELNATYYAIIAEKSASAMEKKTPKDFEFVVKGFRGFTHDPFDSRLEKKPSIDQAMNDIQRFKGSIGPFQQAGKLGAVLLQFPVFFYPSKESKDYILLCKDALKGIELVIEFRNSGWAKDETFEFLTANKLSYCVVDEPKLPRLMPFINKVTGNIAYLRLHGRNKNWFNAPTSERYDYFYSDHELKEFVPEVRKMASGVMKTYTFFNNCHAGSAAKNADRIKELLMEGGIEL